MIYEDTDDRGVAAYEYLRQQLDFLDTLSSKHADITSHVLAREGVPFIMPLSRIWSEGQVKASDYHEDFQGMVCVIVGIMLILFGLLMVKYIDSPGSFAVIFGMFAAGTALLAKGWQLGQRAAEYARRAQRRAHWAAHTLSLMDEPGYVPKMLEACFRVRTNRVTKTLVEPVGRQLIKILPAAYPDTCGQLNREALNAIRRILTRKCKLNYGAELTEEVVGLVGRLGIVEFVGEIERLIEVGATPAIRDAAGTCARTLNEIVEKQRLGGTLLRPSAIPHEPDELLLLPADEGGFSRPEILLRPIQDEK